MRGVLADTSALVALYSPADAGHVSCVREVQKIDVPLLTCWPVLTEAAWLLGPRPRGVSAMLSDCQSGIFSVLALDQRALPFILEFMTRYASARPDLADACLVYLAEREGIDTIFTLDRRDFSIFRLKGKRAFTIIP